MQSHPGRIPDTSGDERRELARHLYGCGISLAHIARTLGCSLAEAQRLTSNGPQGPRQRTLFDGGSE